MYEMLGLKQLLYGYGTFYACENNSIKVQENEIKNVMIKFN